MGFAIGWDTPDGTPTMPFFIILGGMLTLITVSVVLGLRWRDRRQQLRERQPWQQVILRNRDLVGQVAQLASRHEWIICQRGQWLADQVTEHGEQLERVETAVSQILDVAAEEYPRVKRGALRVVKGG